VSFADITLCVASQRVIANVRVYFVNDSVRKLVDTPSYTNTYVCTYVRTYVHTYIHTYIYYIHIHTYTRILT
jgi:hypothetical protein